jgi:16S rRNA (uracil1498-N3)-methyltransferase
LFTPSDLTAGSAVIPDDTQAHYLVSVMRRRSGDPVWLFNGRDGEWIATFEPSGKRGCRLIVTERRRVQQSDIDLWLVFAPVKNARIEILIEKATELGVSALVPVLTERTIVRKLNQARLLAHAIEAAEQSNRMAVPDMRDLAGLDQVLADWPNGRRLIYADEIGSATLARQALVGLRPGPLAVLIGPEGGFSTSERDRILALADAIPISLGPRLLRADTAALAALALVQGLVGDPE